MGQGRLRLIVKLLILTFFAFSKYSFTKELVIPIGAERVLSFDEDVVRVGLEQDGIVRARPHGDKKSLTLSGLSRGFVSMELLLRSGKKEIYEISVGQTQNTIDKITSQLSRIPGVRLKRTATSLIASGKINSLNDGEMFDRIFEANKKIVIDQTERPYKDNKLVTNTINKILQREGLNHYQAKNYGKIIVLEGTPRDEKDRAMALRIARIISPEIIDNIPNTPAKSGPSISIDVVFLEYNKTDNLQVGLKKDGLGTSIATFTTPIGQKNAVDKSFIYTFGPAELVLKLTRDYTNTKVISNPRLVVRSGEEAQFLAGGELYLTASSTNNGVTTTNYVPVPFGVDMQVTPYIDSLGQIDVKLSIEVSEFTSTGASNTQPNKNSSKTKTSITLQDGYSIILTGFKKSSNTKTVSKIPLFGDIPIFGELFKSRSFTDTEKDLLVLLTVKSAYTQEEQQQLSEITEKSKIVPGSMLDLSNKGDKEVAFSIYD